MGIFVATVGYICAVCGLSIVYMWYKSLLYLCYLCGVSLLLYGVLWCMFHKCGIGVLCVSFMLGDFGLCVMCEVHVVCECLVLVLVVLCVCFVWYIQCLFEEFE